MTSNTGRGTPGRRDRGASDDGIRAKIGPDDAQCDGDVVLSPRWW